MYLSNRFIKKKGRAIALPFFFDNKVIDFGEMESYLASECNWKPVKNTISDDYANDESITITTFTYTTRKLFLGYLICWCWPRVLKKI